MINEDNLFIDSITMFYQVEAALEAIKSRTTCINFLNGLF